MNPQSLNKKFDSRENEQKQPLGPKSRNANAGSLAKAWASMNYTQGSEQTVLAPDLGTKTV